MARISPIRTEADRKAALARIDALMDVEVGTPEADELSVLAELVETYETKHFPMELPTPVEAIRFRMEQAGLEQRLLTGQNFGHLPADRIENLRGGDTQRERSEPEPIQDQEGGGAPSGSAPRTVTSWTSA